MFKARTVAYELRLWENTEQPASVLIALDSIDPSKI